MQHNTPSEHFAVSVHWNVGHEFVVILIMAVRSTKPLVKAMAQREKIRSMTQMP